MNAVRHLAPLAVALTLGAYALTAASAPLIEVYKSPYCGCCGKWVEHVRQAGFEVKVHEVTDTMAARAALGMSQQYASCHTAKVGGYTVEGHVPAADITRLFAERPRALGLAAPGMPQGAPGMESATPQPYEVLLVGADGSAGTFARH